MEYKVGDQLRAIYINMVTGNPQLISGVLEHIIEHDTTHTHQIRLRPSPIQQYRWVSDFSILGFY